MPLIRTRALILHSLAYGDTSKILRLLTYDYGIRSVIAKGAQRPKSRFGGILEPFTEGEVQFNLREGRDLYTLSGFTLIRSRQGIGGDLQAFTGASLVAEILLRYATDEFDPILYDLVRNGFDTLAARDVPDPRGTALTVLWRIVSHFGFQPELEGCVRCGRSIAGGETTRFDAGAGGVVCRTCASGGLPLSPAHRIEVDRMSRGLPLPVPATDRRMHGDLLHAFLSAHLLQGRPLRSLHLFLEQLR